MSFNEDSSKEKLRKTDLRRDALADERSQAARDRATDDDADEADEILRELMGEMLVETSDVKDPPPDNV